MNVWAAADGAGVTRAVDDRGVCTTYDREWLQLATTVASRRSTTSSRHPGRAMVGTVVTSRRGLVRCVCGGMRTPFDGPHSPVVVSVGTVRDCTGKLWRRGADGYEAIEGA